MLKSESDCDGWIRVRAVGNGGLSINVGTLLHSCFICRYHCTCIISLSGLQSSVVLMMFFADCRQRHECVIHVAAGCRQYRRHMSHQD